MILPIEIPTQNVPSSERSVATSLLADLLAQSIAPVPDVPAKLGIPVVDGGMNSNAVIRALRFTGRGQLVCLRMDLGSVSYGPDFYRTWGPLPFRFLVRSVVLTAASSQVWFGLVPFFSRCLLDGQLAGAFRNQVVPMIGTSGSRLHVPGAWCPDEAGMVGVLPVSALAPRDCRFVGVYLFVDGWGPASVTANIECVEVVEP